MATSKSPFNPQPIALDIYTKHDFITFVDTMETYYYVEGVYKPYGEAVITSLAHSLIIEYEPPATRHKVGEVLAFIKRYSLTERMAVNMTTGSYENLLNVKNGYLNIRTGELAEHSPIYYFTNMLPVEYRPEAACPNITKFLGEVLRPEDLPALQEAVGYCLLRDYRFQKAFMFTGKGANGKSKLLALVQTFLGLENCSAASLQAIAYNRFTAAELYGKMANICADLPSSKITSSGTFKTLTGGDRVSAERKGCHPFEFTNYAKLFFSANAIPATTDDSNAYYRRWLIFDFPNSFEGAKNDPNILQKLTTPEELSGFLNWALEGLKRLLQNNGFSGNKTTEEAREDYIRRSDPEKAFAMDHLIEDHNGTIPQDALYALYIGYCDQNKLQKQTKVGFFRNSLPKTYPSFKKSKRGTKGDRYWIIEGLRVKTPEDEEEAVFELKDVSKIDSHLGLILDTKQGTLETGTESNFESVHDVNDVHDIPLPSGVYSKVQDVQDNRNTNEIDRGGGDKLQQVGGIILDTEDTGTSKVGTLLVSKAINYNQTTNISTILFSRNYISFVGIDGRTYGPFLAQDVASIPAENARVIVEQGAALYADFPVEPEDPNNGQQRPTTAQHTRLTTILDLVKSLEREYGTAKKAEILEQAAKNGIPEPEAEKGIEKLKLDGHIFEPKNEVYKST